MKYIPYLFVNHRGGFQRFIFPTVGEDKQYFVINICEQSVGYSVGQERLTQRSALAKCSPVVTPTKVALDGSSILLTTPQSLIRLLYLQLKDCPLRTTLKEISDVISAPKPQVQLLWEPLWSDVFVDHAQRFPSNLSLGKSLIPEVLIPTKAILMAHERNPVASTHHNLHLVYSQCAYVDHMTQQVEFFTATSSSLFSTSLVKAATDFI